MTLAFPNVNLARERVPSIRRALGYLPSQSWRGAELERDLSQAAAEMFGGGPAHPGTVTIPTDDVYLSVLREVGVRTPGSEAATYAARAMSEGVGGLNSVTIGNTAGSVLVGFDDVLDSYALALTSSVVLRKLPDISTVPVTTVTGSIPAETAIATTAAIAEAGANSATDPSISGLPYTLRKIAAYRVLSSELMSTCRPGHEPRGSSARCRGTSPWPPTPPSSRVPERASTSPASATTPA